MKLLLTLGIFLGMFSQATAQYQFYITSEADNPFALCVGNTITFHLDHDTVYQPDSVFMLHGATRMITNDDWTIIGGKYDFKATLKPGTYDPILYVYRNGTLTRLILDKRISIHDDPKADFTVIADNGSCGKHVFTCLENRSASGANKHPIEKIYVDWGDGETSSQLEDTLCHIYMNTGSMNLVYRVIDSKGCENTKEVPNAFDVKSSITFSPELRVGKLDSISQKAPLEIAFKNLGNDELDSLEIATVLIKQQTNAQGNSGTLYSPYHFSKGSNGFIDPFSKLVQNLEAGKYRINIALKSHKGCQAVASKEVIIGHLSKTRAVYKCSDEPVKFVDSTFYWNKKGQAFCELINWWGNTTCIDTNDFFKRPKSVRKKLYGKIAGYQPPKIAERIAWDFENDGIIDLWDKYSPSHTYPKPGNKTCAMWTRDSTGAWQKSVVKFYLHEVKPSARLYNGLTHTCLMENVKLKLQDTSKVPQTIKYIWREGKRSEIKDEYLNLNLWSENALFFDVETDRGCRVSFTEENLIKVMGVKTSFIRISDDTICNGDFLEYQNTSDSADYAWTIESWAKTESYTTKDLRVNFFEGNPEARVILSVRLSSSITFFNPDTEKDEKCYSSFGTNRTTGTHITRPQSVEFEPYKRLGTAEMQFKVLDSLPEKATNYYTINGGPKQLVTNVVEEDLYSWYFNIDFGTYGKYEVCLYSYTPLCSDSFCTTIWTEDVGINDINNSHIKAYPNPVNDALTLSSKRQGWYEIRSITGQLLLSAKLTKGHQQIDLSFLAKGSYILQVQTEEERVSMPLVKN